MNLTTRHRKHQMEIVRGEETLFNIDEVSDIVKETIERVLGGSEYLPEKVNRWTADIVDQILTVLTNLDKPFKYIVQSIVMQKNGAGLHTASSCFWDNATDGSSTIRWENKHLYVIVSVFGLSI